MDDEFCASFSAKLDIELKYYQMMPYDSDDSDFDWHKHQPASDDSDAERSPSKPSAKIDDAQCNNIEKTPMMKNRRDPRDCKRKKKSITPPKAHTRKVTVMPSEGKEIKTGLGAQTSTYSEDILSHQTPTKSETQPLIGLNQTAYQFDESLTPNSDSDEDARLALQRHRKLISGNSSANTVKKDSTDDSTTFQLPTYPNNWETVEPTAYGLPTYSNDWGKVGTTHLNTTFPPSGATLKYSPRGTNNCNNEFQIPPKRTRWSSSVSSSDSSVEFRSSYSNDLMPSYKNYQLLGDSQLLRFSEQLLDFRRYVSYTVAEQKCRRLGYCVSGQKIGDLQQRLLRNEVKLGPKVVMLIGTNDMVYDTNLQAMCANFRSILNILKENGVQKIVTLTVPPVPKLERNTEYLGKLRTFNNHIINLAEEGRIFPIDLASLYISYDNKPNLKYFEQTFGKTSKVDLVHLNHDGFKLLKAVLDINYFEKFRFDNR